MPVYTYKDFPCILTPEGASSLNYRFLAQSLSISFENQLVESRSFGATQDLKTFRIGGPRSCSVDLSWAVCTSGNPAQNSYNALSGILNHMTGNNSGVLNLGGYSLSGAYLLKAAVSIQPFEPVIASASFVCSPPTIIFSSASPFQEMLPPNKIAYGYTTEILGGALLTDSNNSSIQFSINCSRTPSFRIGDSGAFRYLLDGVTKEIVLNATNIGNVINFSGYGDSFTATIKNVDAENIASLTMGANSKIISQNLAVQDNSVINGSVVMKEIVF